MEQIEQEAGPAGGRERRPSPAGTGRTTTPASSFVLRPIAPGREPLAAALDLALSLAGGAGWLGAGPLVATLLVGRTALFFPSARWLLAAALTWMATLLLAWASTRGLIHPGRLPLLERLPDETAGQRSRVSASRRRPPSAGAASLVLALCRPLVPLGCVAPLLPLLYLDDQSYHLVAGSSQAPAHTLVVLTFLLAIGGAAGVALQPLLDPAPGLTISQPEALPAGLERRQRPALLAPLLGMAVMLAANQGIFGPLQAAHGTAQWITTLWGLGAAGLAAVLGAAAAQAPWPAALGLWAAWLLFSPWQEGLATRAAASGLLLALTAAFWLLARGSRWAVGGAGVVLGLAGAAAPAVLWPVGALALAGARRAALGGVLATLVGLAVRAWLEPPARLWEMAGQALGASPHLDNAAGGGFYARLFSGPGALTAAGTSPSALPTLVLTTGTLATGALVVARIVRAVATAAPSAEQEALRTPRLLAAAVLALVSGLLLDGTTPRAELALAALVLIPAASVPLWAALASPTRRVAGVLLVAGYALAATSTQELAHAGAALLSRSPALATLPALGLVLLASGLALLASNGHGGSGPGSR